MFKDTPIAGMKVFEPKHFTDERGYFVRGFHAEDFAEAGLMPLVLQNNISFNHLAGTVRGLHFQYPPAAEAKLVRCTHGSVYDVCVDLRPESKTYGETVGVKLSGLTMIYIPERCAHGYQTLEDGTEVSYLLNRLFAPHLEFGLRPDDPRLGIPWPLTISKISDKDRKWPWLSNIESDMKRRMTK